METHERRRARFESVGLRLVHELRTAWKDDTDTEIQGQAGEDSFRTWLNAQLPTRFRAMRGAVLAADQAPSTQRDCVLFDHGECPVFRQSGGQPDLFPVEGVIGCIEINTGSSGATYQKLIRDCEKLSEIGRQNRSRQGLMPRASLLKPLPLSIAPTLSNDIVVSQMTLPLPPILYLFAENARGTLEELGMRIVQHNKKAGVSDSVGGAFILNQGFILHMHSNTGWEHTRLQGSSLAYIHAEPWEVLLKMMTIIWNFLYKISPVGCDLGAYYADVDYYRSIELPRSVIVSDDDYVAQQEPGFYTVRS